MIKTIFKPIGLFTIIILLAYACSTSYQVDTTRWKPNIKNKSTQVASASDQVYLSEPLQIKRRKIAESAKRYLGSPYKYGGDGTDGFDCSGFTSKIFAEHGYRVSGPSYMQAKQGKSKSAKEAQPGDLVVFKKEDGKVFHVALVTDVSADELWVAHSTSSKGVILSNVLDSKYWAPKIDRVQDVLSD